MRIHFFRDWFQFLLTNSRPSKVSWTHCKCAVHRTRFLSLILLDGILAVRGQAVRYEHAPYLKKLWFFVATSRPSPSSRTRMPNRQHRSPVENWRHSAAICAPKLVASRRAPWTHPEILIPSRSRQVPPSQTIRKTTRECHKLPTAPAALCSMKLPKNPCWSGLARQTERVSTYLLVAAGDLTTSFLGVRCNIVQLNRCQGNA